MVIWSSPSPRPCIENMTQYQRHETTPPVPSIWNSPTMAMSDVERLAYRSPVAVPILPADLRSIDQSTALSFPATVGTQPAMDLDMLWNRGSVGRGRGAQLIDSHRGRDVVHRNAENLHLQLRLASGVGYGNESIEVTFQNEEGLPQAMPIEQTVTNGLYDDDDLPCVDKTNKLLEATRVEEARVEEAQVEEARVEEEEELLTDDGGWNWVARTKPPDSTSCLPKNVALASLRKKLRRKDLAKEEKESSPVPINLSEAKQAPQVASVPMMKEDWRAEIKAIEKASNAKSKKGWRSAADSEPLLGNLKIDQNWSMFAPNMAAENVEDFPSLASYVTAETSPPKSEIGLDLYSQRNERKKSKKNRNVRLMWEPEERPRREPTSAPPGYLMPTNGVPPIAIHNPEYNPRNTHITFGNLFEKSAEDFSAYKYKKRGEFSLMNDDFPQLK